MNKLKKKIHTEVLRIAEDLISTSKTDRNGRFWNTFDREPYGEAFEQENEQIYNGVSGIALFFIGLYQYEKDNKHLKIAEESLQWCIHQVRSSKYPYYTFYTGAIGVIYALIKLYEVTGKKEVLKDAEDLLEETKKGIDDKVLIDDLLSGNAGNLFVITYLYLHTGSQTSAEMVNLLLQRLIDNTRISKSGLKWGYFHNSLDSLTGLSHGASGIAHVLMEIAKTIKMPALNWMADKALCYEDEYYSKSLACWIDMRIYPEHRRFLIKERRSLSFYLNHKKDLIAWAHGVIGMGMVRLGTFERTKEVRHKKKAERALTIIVEEIYKEATFANFTLSTGVGSWIEMLLNGARVLNKTELITHALFLAEKGLEHRNHLGMYASAWFSDRSDASLLLGTAGIGYAFLQLLSNQTDSLLLPVLNAPSRILSTKSYSVVQLKREVYGKYFHRTLFLLDKASIDHSFLWSLDNINGVSKGIKSLLKEAKDDQKMLLSDVFNLEEKKVKMAIDPNLNIYREQKIDFFKEQHLKLKELTTDDFGLGSYILSEHVRIMKTKWIWDLSKKNSWSKNAGIDLGDHAIVLWVEIDHVAELYINTFSATILFFLNKRRSFSSLMSMLMRKFSIDDKAKLEMKLIEQLKTLLEKQFLEFQQ